MESIPNVEMGPEGRSARPPGALEHEAIDCDDESKEGFDAGEINQRLQRLEGYRIRAARKSRSSELEPPREVHAEPERHRAQRRPMYLTCLVLLLLLGGLLAAALLAYLFSQQFSDWS
jgi:hypothetical protein